MTWSIRIKSALAAIAHASGMIARRLARRSSEDFALLTYHRVIAREETTGSVQAGMVLEPETLDLHIRFLQKHFKLVPLSEFISAPRADAPTSDGRGKPRCALTFDDGWSDFYRCAYPILKSHRVPATVFLPTDFIGTDRWFWTDRVGLLLDRMGPAAASGSCPACDDTLASEILRLSGNRQDRLEGAITLLKSYRLEQIETSLVALARASGQIETPRGRAFLSWDEVREMAASGLVTFGSHTAGHPILSTLSDAEVEAELTRSRRALLSASAADPSFVPFSYPNGNFNEKLSEMVRGTGYDLAVTTRYGWNRRHDPPYTLRRIGIHQDIASTEALLGARLIHLF